MSWLNTLDHLISQGKQARLHESALTLDALLALPVAERWRCLRHRDPSLRKLTTADHEIFCQSLTIHAALAFGGGSVDDGIGTTAGTDTHCGTPFYSVSQGDNDDGEDGAVPGHARGTPAPMRKSASGGSPIAEATRLMALFLVMILGGFGVLGGLQVSGVWQQLDLVRSMDGPPPVATGQASGLDRAADAVETPALPAETGPRFSIRMVMAAAALLDLRHAVDAGTPFVRELAVVSASLPVFTDHAAIRNTFRTYATTGIATRMALADRLPHVLGAIAAERDRTVLATAERLARRVAGLSDGSLERWRLTKHLLQRVDAAMAAGKLPIAIAILETLPNGCGPAARAWLKAARARARVDAHFKSFLGPVPVIDPLPNELPVVSRLG